MSTNTNDISEYIDTINKYKNKIYTSIYPQIKMIHINFDENFVSLNRYINGYLSAKDISIYTNIYEYNFILNETSVLIGSNILNIISIYNESQIEHIKNPVSTWINPIQSDSISVVFNDLYMINTENMSVIPLNPKLFNMIVYTE